MFLVGQGEQLVLQTLSGDSRNTHVATIDLGYKFQEVSAPSSHRWDGLARLRWGIGGTQLEAVLDWKQGIQISVPAACLSVSAFNENVDIDSQYAAVELRAIVGWGNRAARSYPTRSFRFVQLANGATSPVLPVPNFAYSVQLAAPTLAVYVAGVLLTLFADRAGTIPVQIVSGVDLRAALAGEGIKLHGLARFWTLTNGAAIADFEPFFALSF